MRRVVAGVVLMCGASLAGAADRFWYLGAGLGKSEFGDCPAAAACDRREEAYKIYGGYRLSRHLSVEVGYADFGKITAVPVAGGFATESKPRGATGHVVAAWPIVDRLSILGRVGLIYGDTKVTSDTGSRSRKGTEMAWGIGAQYEFGRDFILRLEWERYRFDDLDVDTVMLGVATAF